MEKFHFMLFTSFLLAASFNNGQNIDYRLPNDLIPIHYDITLVFKNDFIQMEYYQAMVNIKVNVRNRTRTIVLNSGIEKLIRIEITKELDAVYNQYYHFTHFDRDLATQKLTIHLAEELEINQTYNIFIFYNATIGRNKTAGISDFLSGDAKPYYLLWTHFQAVEARNVFPCFDEPQLKTTFNLTIAHPPHFTAIANTPPIKTSNLSNSIVRQFRETPVMSIYLLAFAITNYTSTTSGPITVWSKPGTDENRKRILSQSNKMLEVFNEYTKIEFSSFGIGQIDLVALPEQNAPMAMENWGLITFPEKLLLDYGRNTTVLFEQVAVKIFAHEIAHYWFGNLVTCDWWSHAWINEAFAEYFEYFLADMVNPSWQLDKEFLFNVQQYIFQKDELPNTYTVSSSIGPNYSPNQYMDAFNDIVYYKSACIMRMISHILGDKFKSALRKFLKDNSFKSAKPQDVWDAFDSQSPERLPTGKNIFDIMNGWIDQAGFPVVQVSYKNNQIEISQSSFVLRNFPSNTNWYIPISYIKQSDSNKDDTKPKNWLIPGQNLSISEVLKDDEWIIVNNDGTGFFRVHYDKQLLSRIKATLKRNYLEISDLNRAQILDDLFNLAKIRKVSYAQLFDVLGYLRHETDYHVWLTVVRNYEILLTKIRNSTVQDRIKDSMLYYIEPLYRSVPLNKTNFTDHLYTFKQILAHETACQYQYHDCVHEALSLFQAFRTNPVAGLPNANFQPFIYCTAMRFSWNPKKDWNLINNAKSAESEDILYRIRNCRNLTYVYQRELPNFISFPEISHQFVLLKQSRSLHRRLTSLDTGHKLRRAFLASEDIFAKYSEDVIDPYEFLKKNYENLKLKYKNSNFLENSFIGIASQFTKQEQVDDMKLFFNDKILHGSMKSSVKKAFQIGQENVDLTNQNEKDLREYFSLK